MEYKGYVIKYNFYGRDEYLVKYNEVNVLFDTLEEAKEFIDEVEEN